VWAEAWAAARSQWRGRSVSLFVSAVLCSGIVLAGASIVVFHRVVLNPLPLQKSDQLHRVQRLSTAGPIGFTQAQVQQIADAGVFTAVGGYATAQMTVSGTEPVRVNVITATRSLPETLGLRAILGQYRWTATHPMP
jgi:hypothetical protein